MNIFQEIGLLFKVKSVGEDIIKEAKQMNGHTPGYKSSEFWLDVATKVGLVWGSVSGFIPPKYAAIIAAAGTAVYTIARTALKAYSEIKTVSNGQTQSVSVAATVTPSN